MHNRTIYCKPVITSIAALLLMAPIASATELDSTEALQEITQQTVEVRGIEQGATVNFYKVASYVNGQGYSWLIDSSSLPRITGLTTNIDEWSTQEANLIAKRALETTNLPTTSATATEAQIATANVGERGIWVAYVEDANNARYVYQNMILAVNTADDKTVVDVKRNEVCVQKSATDKSVGSAEVARFVVTTSEPTYTTDATERNYVISDTLPSGLEFSGITSVADSATDFTAGSDYIAQLDGQTLRITFTEEGIAKFKPGENISTTITATRKEGFNGKLTNNAALTFSSDSYSSQTSTTPGSEAYIYDFNLDITKVATGNESIKLPGAVFTLKNSNTGTYVNANGTPSSTPVNLQVDGSGTLAIRGLDEASYELTEVHAPDGYIIEDSPVHFSIEANYDGAKLSSYNITGDKSATGHIADEGNVASINVENSKTGLLPQTGESGTVVLTIVGIGLVACGIAITARRKSNNGK